MSIRITFREYPELRAVVVIAAGTVGTRPFGTSGQGRTRAAAISDMRAWLRFTRNPCNRGFTYGQFRAVRPLYRDE